MKAQSHFILIASASLWITVSSCGTKKIDPDTQAHIDSLQVEVDGYANSKSSLEANKKLVADFYQEVFGDKNVAALDKYIADDYIQHNPILADGKAALQQAVTAWFVGAAKERIDIQHLSAEGDLVYIHTKQGHEGKVSSIIDIFRIKNNMIVEHWDVIQAVPEKSANAHPMF